MTRVKAKPAIWRHIDAVIEPLEPRRLLAGNPVSWIGTTGNWAVASNWSNGKVPNAAKNVSLPAGAIVTVSDSEMAKEVIIAQGAQLIVDGNIASPAKLQAFAGISNGGDLEIGAGGIVIVENGSTPAYTQSAGGVLTIEIGGAPATGHFGQLMADGSIIIAGGFQTVVLGLYSPAAGDDFEPLAYTGVTGNFSSFSTIGGGTFAFAPVITPAGAVLIATADTTAPTSTAAVSESDGNAMTFSVTWSGSDNVAGSGIKSYDIFVSDNGGTFTPFQTNTTLTSAPFTGQVGHIYGFVSVAMDNAGNTQPTPSVALPQATIDLDGTITPVFNAEGKIIGTIIRGTDAADTVRISESAGNVIVAMDGTNRSIKASNAGLIDIEMGAGNDNITVAPTAPAVSVNGGGGADTIIVKNSAADTINGGAGADSITGGSGNELLEGGNGSNTLIAGSGNTTLVGGAGADSILGGAGADLLLGGGGRDTIAAGSDDSTINGGGGLDGFLG